MRFAVFCYVSVIMACAAGLAETAPAQAPVGSQAEQIAEARKLLTDSKPNVRLQAALALIERDDEQAVSVLIDLLAELPEQDRLQAESALQQMAGEWSPRPALPSDDELSRKIRRAAWASWWRTLDGTTLLAAFQGRTANKDGKDKLPLSTPRLLAIRKPPGAAVALL